MMDEATVQEIVRQLENLGGPAWEYALRQAYVSAIANGVVAILMLVLIIGGVFFARFAFHEHLERTDAYNDGWGIAMVMTLLMVFVAFISFILSAYASATTFANPHYEAMELLARILRG